MFPDIIDTCKEVLLCVVLCAERCAVLDTNDRFLRKITIGQSATEKGFTREVDLLFSIYTHLDTIVLSVWLLYFCTFVS